MCRYNFNVTTFSNIQIMKIIFTCKDKLSYTYSKDLWWSKNRHNQWQNFDFARKLREQNKRNILNLHFASMQSVSKPALYIDCICKAVRYAL